ncbi:MAG: lipoate--protein ligase [Clostridia bacterium]|nr:lipoate--protein ligase [Clostridia bacterium]
MRVIYNQCLDPYFNLASEEFLLERCEGDIFMIWRNEKSVIIGKNQNAYAEVDRAFCKERGVKVVRRLTGGGAVFHDEGNVNFSFVTDAVGEGIDFYPFTSNVCSALSSFGIKALANGRNDIEVAGVKVSGNAQCVHNCKDKRRRLLHHGTLLFSADLSDLSGALRPRADKMESKGIKSVRSRVGNIRDMEGYVGPGCAEGFARALCRLMGGDASGDFSEAEKAEIRALSEKKYSTWQWSFGEGPRFSDTVNGRFPYGGVEISFSARHGAIEEIKISGDFFALRDMGELEERLVGVTLEPTVLAAAFSDVCEYIHGARAADICGLFAPE